MKGDIEMDFLKKFWMFSFKKKNEVKDLVIPVVIYFCAPTVVGILNGILAYVPGTGIIRYIIGSVLGLFSLYCTAGIAFCFLNYFKVGPFKDDAQA